MSFIPLKRKHTRKPSFGARLDRSNEIAKGLTYAILPDINYDLVSESLLARTDTGSPVKVAGKDGTYLSLPDGSFSSYSVGDWSCSSYTIAMVVKIDAIDNPWGGLFAKVSTGTSHQMGLQRQSTSNNFRLNQANSVTLSTSSISSIIGEYAKIVLNFQGSTATMYINSLDNKHTETIVGGVATGSGALYLAAEASASATYDSDAAFSMFTFSKDAMWSEAQTKSWLENPYQILQPQTQYIEAGAAVAGVTGKSNPLYGCFGGCLQGAIA